MAIHSDPYSLRNCCLPRGNHAQFSQFSFTFANWGQTLCRSKELPLLRRTDTRLGAERVRRRPQREGVDRWQNAGRDAYEEVEATSSWDANAENVRRRRFKRSFYPRPEKEEEEPSPSMRERNSRSDTARWDYGGNGRAGDRQGDFGRTDRYENSEWDYESEANGAQTKAEGWRWWFAEKTNDNYEEGDDYEEEEDNWLSWLDADIKDVLMLLRWGLPAAFLLYTAVVPVVIGNPLMLLFGFSIFPTAVKFLNPVVKDLFRSAANPFASSSSTRTKQRRRPSATQYSRRSEDTSKDTGFGPPSPPTSRSYDAEAPRQSVPLKASGLGGWDDLVEDRFRNNAESQWPLQRRSKSGRKLARREQPLVIRVILAFFPFLRGWAGLF